MNTAAETVQGANASQLHDNNTQAIVETRDDFRSYLESKLPAIAEANLIQKVGPEFILSEILACVRAQPKLMECDRVSVVNAALLAVQSGLSLNPVAGECYLIPRFNSRKGKLYCNYQPGYKGVLKIMYRNPRVKDIGYGAIRKADSLRFADGDQKSFTYSYDFTKTVEERGPVVGYYAIVRFHGGGFNYVVWTAKEMMDFAETYRSDKKAQKKGLWDGSPGEFEYDKMAFKTMLIQVSNTSPGNDPLLREIEAFEEFFRRGDQAPVVFEEGRVAIGAPPPVVSAKEAAEVVEAKVKDVVKEVTPAPKPAPRKKTSKRKTTKKKKV